MRRLHSVAAILLAAAAWPHPAPASDIDAALAGLVSGPDRRLEIASARSKSGELTFLLEVIGQAGIEGSRARLVRLVTTEPDGSRRQSEWLEGRPRRMTVFRFGPGQKEWIHTGPVTGVHPRPWPTRNAEQLKRAYSTHLEASDFAAMELVEITGQGENHVLHKRGRDGKFAPVRRFFVRDEGVE